MLIKVFRTPSATDRDLLIVLLFIYDYFKKTFSRDDLQLLVRIHFEFKDFR